MNPMSGINGGLFNGLEMNQTDFLIFIEKENVDIDFVKKNRDEPREPHNTFEEMGTNEVKYYQSTITHEIGHAIDTTYFLSHKDEFKDLYDRYKKEEREHIHESTEEMFVHCFDLYINNSERLKNE